MRKLSIMSFDLAEEFLLSKAFFEANLQKADSWFLHAQKIIVQMRSKNVGVVATTGWGKTVVALLAAIMSGKRCLFLVPTKQLAYEHQGLLRVMAPNVQSQVITGTISFWNRVWDDVDDRIVFATGDVAWMEIQARELNLECIEMIVADEMHHAASDDHSYSKIFNFAENLNLDIWRLGLTASPGNKPEKIMALWRNCLLDSIMKVDAPDLQVRTSIVYSELTEAFADINHSRAGEIILDQLAKALERMNSLLDNLSLGKRLSIDPKKTFHRTYIDELRKQLRGLGKIQVNSAEDIALAKKLSSALEYYAFWAHIYSLYLSESFLAIERYFENSLSKKNTWYAKVIKAEGVINMLIGLTRWQVHPKQEMTGKIMESIQRRGLQAIVFVNNKATGESYFQYAKELGVSADVINGDMSEAVKQGVLNGFRNRTTACLIATDVLREGYSLTADVVINAAPASYPIQSIQRDGRAGRFGKIAEIIIVVAEHERFIVPAVQRQIKRMSKMDYSKGVMPSLPRTMRGNSLQPTLF